MGCTAAVPAPALCDMPPGHRSWHGAQVEWSGIVIGEGHHGYVLACEHRQGGVQLDWSDRTVGGEALRTALERTRFRQGVLRIAVEGKLGRRYGPGRFGFAQDPSRLRLDAIRSIEYVPMSREEFEAFMSAAPRTSAEARHSGLMKRALANEWIESPLSIHNPDSG